MALITVWVTLGWSLLNLAPILPLDGGHVVATALERFLGLKGVRVARILSITLALGVGGALLVLSGDLIWGMVGGILAFVNYRAYRLERFWQQEQPLQKDLKRATEALARGDAATARALAEGLRERAVSPETRSRVQHLLAWARLTEGDAGAARRELDALPKGVRPDAYLDGKVHLARGDASGALGPLVEALEDRSEEEVAVTVAEAVAEAGRLDELASLLESEPRSRTAGRSALQRVAYRLFELGEHDLAGELYGHLFARFADPLDAFNAACARVRRGDTDVAVEWLERAVDAGLEETRLIDTDEDLAPLRGHPALDALRARARA
jgi:thioredoxin-like negative regulator of GroEL